VILGRLDNRITHAGVTIRTLRRMGKRAPWHDGHLWYFKALHPTRVIGQRFERPKSKTSAPARRQGKWWSGGVTTLRFAKKFREAIYPQAPAQWRTIR
jgi:hypothetical protein